MYPISIRNLNHIVRELIFNLLIQKKGILNMYRTYNLFIHNKNDKYYLKFFNQMY